MAVRNREEVKEEAVKRLKLLQVHENVVSEFLEGKLNKSVETGSLYWLTKEEQVMVKEFEEYYKMMVYHVIWRRMNIGGSYSFLCVNMDDSDWMLDREDLEKECPFVYVVNDTLPDCSKFGYISIEPCNGGIIRRW